MLGEMIVIGLGRGNELADLVLAVSNVTVGEDDDDEGSWLEGGDYVAVTVKGPGAGRMTPGVPGKGPPAGCLRTSRREPTTPVPCTPTPGISAGQAA
jgi:hypothetical protein